MNLTADQLRALNEKLKASLRITQPLVLRMQELKLTDNDLYRKIYAGNSEIVSATVLCEKLAYEEENRGRGKIRPG